MSNSFGVKRTAQARDSDFPSVLRSTLWEVQGSTGLAFSVLARPVVYSCLVLLWLLMPPAIQGQVPESLSPQLDTDTQRAISIEESVVAARRAIRNGEADVVYKGSNGNDIRRWKLWFQGDKLRMEQFGSSRELPAKIVKSDGQIYHKRVGIHEKSKEPSFGTAEIHPDNYNGTMLFDLRRLGITMVPTGVLHSINDWNHTLGTQQRLRSTVADVEFDGRPVHLITRFDLDGDVTKLWVDEERGPSLVRGEHTAHHRGKEIVDVLVAELEQFDGVWFPQRVTHHRTVDGNGPPAQETTLENVRLDQGVDDNLFTLGSVGVEAGELVTVTPTPAGGMPIWDGTKLVKQGSPTITVKPAPVSTVRRWIGVVNLAFAAICVLLYLWKRRVPPSSLPREG